MADAFACMGLIALCGLLLPLSGWWLAARLREESLFRFAAACLAGVTVISVAELIAYVLHLPQLVAVALVAVACTFSLPHVILAIRKGQFAWDALLIWTGASAILVAATMNYAVHGGP